MFTKYCFILMSAFILNGAMVNSGCTMKFTDAELKNPAFEPETSPFSRLATVRTWAADHHHANERKMRQLCCQLSMTDPANPTSQKIFIPVQNNPGDARYFGKIFPTLPGIELPFLKWVKEVSTRKAPVTLEMAAGFGFVSWKTPFAFSSLGGMHYVNELSKPMLDAAFSQVIPGRLETDLQTMLRPIPGSCFDILEEHPELAGHVDALYVQNLEHFFNPETHGRFIRLVSDLLAPGGKAFLSADTFTFSGDGEDLYYKLYKARKAAGDLYPGFVEREVEFLQQLEGQGIPQESHRTLSATRPDDAAEIRTETLEEPVVVSYQVPGTSQSVPLRKVRQLIVSNAFAPSIYKGVVAQVPGLEVEESFFMENDGSTKRPLWSKETSRAAAIIRKN